MSGLPFALFFGSRFKSQLIRSSGRYSHNAESYLGYGCGFWHWTSYRAAFRALWVCVDFDGPQGIVLTRDLEPNDHAGDAPFIAS